MRATPQLDGRPEVVVDEGPRLKATGNDVAIETLEIAHEGLELE